MSEYMKNLVYFIETDSCFSALKFSNEPETTPAFCASCSWEIFRRWRLVRMKLEIGFGGLSVGASYFVTVYPKGCIKC